MKLKWWTRVATFVLLLSLFSLPAWAKRHHPVPVRVPEGGSASFYVILSGLATFGGLLLAHRQGSSTAHPPKG
jgi:hypothetical protein